MRLWAPSSQSHVLVQSAPQDQRRRTPGSTRKMISASRSPPLPTLSAKTVRIPTAFVTVTAVSRDTEPQTTAIAFKACICCHNVSMVCPESIAPNASHHGDASPPSCRITQQLKQPCKLTTRYEKISQVIRKRERHSLAHRWRQSHGLPSGTRSTNGVTNTRRLCGQFHGLRGRRPLDAQTNIGQWTTN